MSKLAAKTKKTTSKATKAKTTTISPFKSKALLEKEIVTFINKFKSTVKSQSSRISDYFEMSCFNYIVKFYAANGYDVRVENLIGGEYRYKCSPSGVQSNFSNFTVRKKDEGLYYEFEIQHNLAVQSSHDKELYTTPDICVIEKGKSKTTTGYYDTQKRFSFVDNEHLATFCEVKHFNPYPELVFNFIGTINELRKEIIDNSTPDMKPVHLAPSLLTSGKPNKQTKRIKQSLENRYCINIIYDVFFSGTKTFSKRNIKGLRLVGKLPSVNNK